MPRKYLLPGIIVPATIISIFLLSGMQPATMNGTWPDVLLNQLRKFNFYFPQEKVFIHTDKPYYFSGDDIWFKAYVLEASEHRPSQLSSIVYIELVAQRDSIVRKLLLKLDNGSAHGDFKLPYNLPEGMYRIRAYTNWMCNFDESFFFQQDIKIWNPARNNVETVIQIDPKKVAGGDSINILLRYFSQFGNPLTFQKFKYRVLNNYDKPRFRDAVTDEKGFGKIRLYISEKEKKLSSTLETEVFFDRQFQRHKYQLPLSENQVDLQFFPEGGEIIAGFVNKIAFKATNEYGKGIFVSGTVYDSDSSRVLDFQALHQGMGTFRFQPKKDKSYFAKIKLGTGKIKQIPLPKVKNEGFLLSVSTAVKDTFLVKVFFSDSILNSANESFAGLLASMRQRVYYAAKCPIKNRMAIFPVPASLFPGGIVQFTLFNTENTAVCERLAFQRKRKMLKIDILAEKKTYKPREKIWLEFTVTSPDTSDATANLSVSVTDNDKINPDTYTQPAGIFTSLLLTSDLKGYIEDPEQYFRKADEETDKKLDLVMLTHGWRRFEWREIVQDRFPRMSQPVEKGLYISGRLRSLFSKPIVNGTVTMVFAQGVSNFKLEKTNEKGAFLFDGLNFEDSTRFVLQGKNSEGSKNVELQVDMPFEQPFSISPNMVSRTENIFSQSWNIGLSINDKKSIRPQKPIKEVMLEEVEIVKSREQPVRPSGSMSGADFYIRGEDLRSPTGNIMDGLMGRVAGMVITADPTNPGNYSVQIRGISSVSGSTTPLLVLDGMQFANDLSPLQSVNVRDVESVEVLKDVANTAMYGASGGNGVIIVKTKRGAYTPEESEDVSLKVINPRGYYRARVFYSPRYDILTPDRDKPDNRTTLFWEPELKIGSTGKGRLTFFNSDDTKSLRIKVQGISPDGIPAEKDVILQIR